ncbi:hypothetical protein ABPG72_002280 [Tetrahymena utriculariae]
MSQQQLKQICLQEKKEFDYEKQNEYSSPTYRARSFSRNKVKIGNIQEMRHEKAIQSVCSLGLNYFISMSCDKQIKIWNYSNQQSIFSYQNEYSSCNNLLKIGFCHFLSISGDHGQLLQLIEWNEMKIIQSLNLEEKIVYLQSSPSLVSDHMIVCGDNKGSLYILNIDMNIISSLQMKNNHQIQPLRLVKKIKNRDNSIQMQSVTSMCFLQDLNKLAVGGEKGSIYFYNIQKSKIYKHIPKAHINGRKVSFISQFSKNEKQYIVSAGCDQYLRLFDEESVSILKQVSLNNPIVCGVQLDNQFAAFGEGRHVLLLNLNDLSVFSLVLHKARVNVIDIDRDKQNLIIGDINGFLKVWQLKQDLKQLANENSQQLCSFRQSRQLEYPTTVRKSVKQEENLGNGCYSSRSEMNNFSNSNRYESNSQKFIKNQLKSSSYKKQMIQTKVSQRESSISKSHSKLKVQQSQESKNKNFQFDSQLSDYNVFSTDKKTPLIDQNPSTVSSQSYATSSNYLKNSYFLRSSSGQKIPHFIIPLQTQNQQKLESKSLQSSLKLKYDQSSPQNNTYKIVINGDQKANFESLENVQSADETEKIGLKDSKQNHIKSEQNFIQTSHLEDIQNIDSQSISSFQLKQLFNTNQINSEDFGNQGSIPGNFIQNNKDQIISQKNFINPINQQEEHASEENFYYQLIKQKINQNYQEMSYLKPQTPSQTANQYQSNAENLIFQNNYGQQLNFLKNKQTSNTQFQQALDQNQQIICEPYDIQDQELKEKLEVEERDLRTQIKQQQEEFRNSILKVQSQRSLSSSMQEKSSIISDQAGIPVTYSIASHHISTNNNKNNNLQEDSQSPNLQITQQQILNNSGANVVTQEQFKELLNQINMEQEQDTIIQELRQQETDQNVQNTQLKFQNLSIPQQVQRCNHFQVNQNKNDQSFNEFNKRIVLLEEQQMYNHKQITEIREMSHQNFDENKKIKNELFEIKQRLQSLSQPKRQKKASSQSSRKQSLKDFKVNKQSQISSQFLSPCRIKGRLVNSFQESEQRNSSNELKTLQENYAGNEENQLKKSLRQQINETIQSYKQSQQQNLRNSQKLMTQKFQSPCKLQSMDINSPPKNYIQINKTYISPLKVNWNFVNNDPQLKEQIKISQQNNKMRSLSSDFLGLRKENVKTNEEQNQQQKKLNFDYSSKFRQKTINSMNIQQNVEQKKQIEILHNTNQTNISMLDASNHFNQVKEEEFHKHFQNISAIEEKQQKNNMFFTSINSQNNMPQNQEQQLCNEKQQNQINIQVSHALNSNQQNNYQETKQEQIQNDFKGNNFKQLQNITQGRNSTCQEKKIIQVSQINHQNAYNFDMNQNLKELKIEDQVSTGKFNQQLNFDQQNQNKQQDPYLISAYGVKNKKQPILNNILKINEEKDENNDTLQNISLSLNQPLSSFLTNVQTNQTKQNFSSSQQVTEYPQYLISQVNKKDLKINGVNEEDQIKLIQPVQQQQKPIGEQDQQILDQQKEKDIMIIQNSQNLSLKVQKEFEECVQGMKETLAQNKNDLEILKQEMRNMDSRRKKSLGKIPDHYSSALNFIQEQNQIEWENSQRSYSSRKK